jgi:hypothetical protein
MHLVEEKMVVTKDDLKTIDDFFKYFKIKKPKALKKAMKDFSKNQSLQTQVQLVIALNEAITVDHPLTQLDEIFKPVVEEASKTLFELSFNKDVDDTFTKDK